MNFSRVLTLGVALSLFLTGPAWAQSPPDKSALQENCTGDYLRLCGQFSPDGPEVEQCFKDRAKELSPECSAAIAAYTKKNPRGRKR